MASDGVINLAASDEVQIGPVACAAKLTYTLEAAGEVDVRVRDAIAARDAVIEVLRRRVAELEAAEYEFADRLADTLVDRLAERLLDRFGLLYGRGE